MNKRVIIELEDTDATGALTTRVPLASVTCDQWDGWHARLAQDVNDLRIERKNALARACEAVLHELRDVKFED